MWSSCVCSLNPPVSSCVAVLCFHRRSADRRGNEWKRPLQPSVGRGFWPFEAWQISASVDDPLP